MENTTLSAEERNVLERDGVLLPHREPGKHKIHASFLARMSIPAAHAASGRATGTAIQPVRALHRCSDREACDEVGLAPWFSNAILHPDRVGILYTETLLYWVDSSIQMHFDALVRILRKLKAYASARVGPRQARLV